MRVSLITVSYNCLNELMLTAKSVASQSADNLEYIVVDGGSSDGTAEWLKDGNTGVTKWVSEPDHGIYEAMNKGLAMATGDVVGFLHANDTFADANILKEIRAFFFNHEADFLYADLEYVTNEAAPKVVRYWKSGVFSMNKLRQGWMPPHPTVYFKRELLVRFGDFDTSYRISADYEWMLRVLTAGVKVVYMPTVAVQMRIGGASNKDLRSMIRKSREDWRAIKKHLSGYFPILIMKNIRKVGQFFSRKNN
ncbi:glycosyltransferase family 2 protein [Geofilum sp. OHC36d9]|uniref:glycosyltransferase family 2 protein n=1 Tax=Geofilum sp. OHC36d9 TaxID=3458413 RepID=UPI004033C1EC